jgi:hypothetical protein
MRSLRQAPSPAIHRALCEKLQAGDFGRYCLLWAAEET